MWCALSSTFLLQLQVETRAEKRRETEDTEERLKWSRKMSRDKLDVRFVVNQQRIRHLTLL